MIFGAILAGGIGSRMNIADMPKQFLTLGDKPIIIHTLEKFILNDRIDQIYVGVHKNWLVHMEELAEKYLKTGLHRIRIVEGGADRNSTIMNIVDAVEKEFGNNPEHYLITHDSVRPFITARIIDDNIEAVRKYNACDTVVEATDTIVLSRGEQLITEIPERRFMYQGQTPQSFQIDLLKRTYETLTEEEKSILTDACKIFVTKKLPVYMVRGEVSNLKITTVSDYKIAQAMVGGNPID